MSAVGKIAFLSDWQEPEAKLDEWMGRPAPKRWSKGVNISYLKDTFVATFFPFNFFFHFHRPTHAQLPVCMINTVNQHRRVSNS